MGTFQTGLSQPPPPDTDAPAHSLYKLPAIGLATFLGSPLAGSWLMASNYRRLKRSGAALLAVVLGVIVTGLLIMLAFALPERSNAPRFILFATLAGTAAIAKAAQGNQIADHIQRGGKTWSNWWGVLIGLISLVLVLGICFGVVMLSSAAMGTRYAVGQSEVYYSGAATEADARAIAEKLKSLGYFSDDRGTTVLINKTPDQAIVSFVVSQWPLPGGEETAKAFMTVGRELKPLFPGSRTTIRFVDENISVKNTVEIE